MRTCLHCRQPISAEHGFYEITQQPARYQWAVCSLDCLTKFVRGAEDGACCDEHAGAAR